jgi:hypothetical protein
MIRSRMMMWADHVACMGEKRNAYGVLVRNRKEKNLLEELGADGRIILKCILNGVRWHLLNSSC